MPKFKNSNATFWVIFKQCVASQDRTQVFFKVSLAFLSHPTIVQKLMSNGRDWTTFFDHYDCRTEITSHDRWSTSSQSYQHYLRFYSKVVWWLHVGCKLFLRALIRCRGSRMSKNQNKIVSFVLSKVDSTKVDGV